MEESSGSINRELKEAVAKSNKQLQGSCGRPQICGHPYRGHWGGSYN